MANITAAEVNQLRKQTGAGMMDCKKALVEANGDFEAAIDFLRKKGQKVAAKRSDREANEGVVLAKTNEAQDFGVLIVLNCETDFVAQNADFVAMAERVSAIALDKKPKTKNELLALDYKEGQSISDKLVEEIGKIGEKIQISSYDILQSDLIVAYNHPGNKIASMVALNEATLKAETAGRDVAMQIAAMNPVAVSPDQVDESIRERELAVGREQALEEGKPENMIDKIAQGKLNKFYKENTLMSQQFIKDNSQSVADYLKSVDDDLQVIDFRRQALI